VTSPRRTRRVRSTGDPRVLAYLRVSTEQQAESGAGLDAQRMAIQAEIARRGWTRVEWVIDSAWSGRDLDRPELDAALARLEAGGAEVLIASKLDRISRSVHDFSGLLDRASRQGWQLVCLDVDVDTSTPSGELVAHMVASTAQYERRVISQRTKDALAAKRAAGVRLGRPAVLPERVVRRVLEERAAGSTLRAIAEGLTADGEPTARGGAVWSTSSVQAALGGQDGMRLRWITAREVAQSGGLGVVHALDMVTNTPAHLIDADWVRQSDTTWQDSVSDERCERCVELLRAESGE
jgi:DNA invertase Pin-like site-specific DNA recombinase